MSIIKHNKLTYTVFPNLNAVTKSDRQETWPEFIAMIKSPPVYPSKQACPLLKLGTFGELRNEKNCLRHTGNILTVTDIELDHDAGSQTIDDAHEILFQAGIKAVLHTTASHTPEHPRWRGFLFFSRPLAPHERLAFVRAINKLLGGRLASESESLTQSFYFGRVKGVPYTVLESIGDYIDTVLKIEPVPTTSVTKVDNLMTVGQALTDQQLSDVKEVVMKLGAMGEADSYTDWTNIGMALQSAARNGREPELRNLWIAFSRTSPKFKSNADALEHWDELPGERTGIGAIF